MSRGFFFFSFYDHKHIIIVMFRRGRASDGFLYSWHGAYEPKEKKKCKISVINTSAIGEFFFPIYFVSLKRPFDIHRCR